MAISFPRVEEVAPGDRVSARHQRQLSRAIIARALSGLGDAAKRIVFWWVSAMRQARNPSGFLFPSAAEFHKIYQHIEPSRGEWPVAGPGEPEGINLATTMGSHVFGLAAADVDAEEVRLADPGAGGVPVEEASTPAAQWDLAKRQRGAYDPGTGAMAAPAFEAAIEHYSLTQSTRSPHGNSYGGFFPTPELLGDCADGTSDTPSTPDYQIKFTKISDGSVRTYPGTCPAEPGDVARVIPWPLGYYVVLNNGTVDYLPRAEWIEGPYNGGRALSKAYGGHLPRIMNRFAGEFRGDTAQHAQDLSKTSGKVLQHAFSVQDFLARQYLLAPAFGQSMGEGLVSARYPRRSVSGSTAYAAGTRIGSTFASREGFVIAAFLVRCTNMLGRAVVELRKGTTVVGRATVSGTATSAICVLTTPATGTLQWVLPGGAKLQPGGSIECEAAELMEYKPLIHDLMLVCRLGGARTAGADGTDGSGITEDDARAIWEGYAASGCILKRRADQELQGSSAAINGNAVFDLFRRWSKMCRILPREQILGYAVEDGKSILWLDPRPYGWSSASDLDSLEGITGEIRRTAPRAGWTNRWCLFMESVRYSHKDSSIWKPESLADWAAFSDRCVHWTPSIPPLNSQLALHFNHHTADWAKRSLAPEVVSGYRYALGLNSSATEHFYRSCRLYEPPLEIESAVAVTVDGQRMVKVTLTGRLHHHHDLAPATIDRDVSTWDAGDLTAEAADYRTDENAIREYLRQRYDPTYRCERTGPGNAAAASDILLGSDVPWGACLPNLFLVQLPAEPYLDDNDTRQGSDTPMTHEQMTQIELWLRVMSEGCVDAKTTVEYGCEVGIDFVFDFRWENLCYQVLGIPWVTTLATAPTESLDAGDVREDAPEGFGPLPTCYAAAEVFNQLAAVTNALVDYRIMLPYQFEGRILQDSTSRLVEDVTDADGNVITCPGGSSPGVVWRGNPGDVEAVTETLGWGSVASASSNWVAGFGVSGPNYICSGDAWQVGVTRVDMEYRHQLVDPDAEYAMPEAWRDMVQTDGRFLAIQTTTIDRVIAKVGSASPTTCNGIQIWDADGQPVEWYIDSQVQVQCLFLPSTGRVSAPAGGRVAFIGANDSPICSELQASQSDTQRQVDPVPTDALILTIPLTDPEDET